MSEQPTLPSVTEKHVEEIINELDNLFNEYERLHNRHNRKREIGCFFKRIRKDIKWLKEYTGD